MKTLYTLPFFLSLFLFVGCSHIITLFVAAPKAVHTQTELGKFANKYFWKQFSNGAYDSIPTVLNLLLASSLETPNDPETMAHIGFTHLWAVSERGRLAAITPDIIHHLTLARDYFQRAYNLNPHDARIYGFLASMTLSEGKIMEDKQAMAKGYFMMLEAARRYPEFNDFTIGYTFSILPATDKTYKKAVAKMWENLDLCMCDSVSRRNPSIGPYLKQATIHGKKRVCWNVPIAPHNLEGFFLCFGDMLTKSGDTTLAVRIYQNAKLSPDYSGWAYKGILEDRIRHVAANVREFNDDKAGLKMLGQSVMSCMACHQASTPLLREPMESHLPILLVGSGINNYMPFAQPLNTADTIFARSAEEVHKK